MRQVEVNFKNLQFLAKFSKKYHNSGIIKEIDNIKTKKDKLCNIAQLTQNLVSSKFEFYVDANNQDLSKKIDEKLKKVQIQIKEYEKDSECQE